jgi:hypothetical protein
MLTCTSSWARIMYTFTPSTGPQYKSGMDATGQNSTISLRLVSPLRLEKVPILPVSYRISQLRGREVLQEQEPWCVWPCCQGNWHPRLGLEILPPLYKTGDSRFYVLVERLRMCTTLSSVSLLLNNLVVKVVANNNILLNK